MLEQAYGRGDAEYVNRSFNVFEGPKCKPCGNAADK